MKLNISNVIPVRSKKNHIPMVQFSVSVLTDEDQVVCTMGGFLYTQTRTVLESRLGFRKLNELAPLYLTRLQEYCDNSTKFQDLLGEKVELKTEVFLNDEEKSFFDDEEETNAE